MLFAGANMCLSVQAAKLVKNKNKENVKLRNLKFIIKKLIKKFIPLSDLVSHSF